MNKLNEQQDTQSYVSGLKTPLPLITVAVPVYNSEKHLGQCLESIIHQTYPNLDILLVNDGSTDLSAQICEDYKKKDSRVRVFHKQNGGVGASRNTLLDLLKGEYVTFVDNDDWLEENHITNLYEQLQIHDADISITNFYSYIEDKRLFSFHGDFKNYYEQEYTVAGWLEKQYDSKDGISQCFTVPWGKLYKRELLKDLSFPEDKAVEDDYTTYMIYLRAQKIIYFHHQTYIHRKTSESITGSVPLTDVFPLQSIEERLTLLTIMGYDVSREVSAYKWRLELHREELLKNGKIAEYKRVCKKLELIERHVK